MNSSGSPEEDDLDDLGRVDVASSGLRSGPRNRLMSPSADPVVSSIAIPGLIDILRAVADLNEESGRRRRIEAESPFVIVHAQSVGELISCGPRTVEGQAHVVAFIGLHLEMMK